jgi:light-harvesting complex 1 beta chain
MARRAEGEKQMADSRGGSLSGLTDQEAKEFHAIFITSFIMFTVVAVVAHFLVWQWRPWFPGPEGYGMTIDAVNGVVNSLKSAFV